MKIALLIPYFGKFPEWADLYFETLRRNPSIDFIFYTDCASQKYRAKNIKFVKTNFEEYVKWVNSKIDVDFRPANPYKLCDLRPLYGYLHRHDFHGYDFYGWTDMDILFSDIRSFYTDDILSKFEVISSHAVRISGHLALFKNSAKNRGMYKKIYDWKNKLEHPEFVGIDEHGITNAYRMTFVDKFNEKYGFKFNNIFTQWLGQQKKRKLYLKEQYTTPFTSIPWLDGTIHSQHPSTWYYEDGAIKNKRDGDRQFMYLHLMNFKSSQWRHDGTSAPWEGKNKICYATVGDMPDGITIDERGILPSQK